LNHRTHGAEGTTTFNAETAEAVETYHLEPDEDDGDGVDETTLLDEIHDFLGSTRIYGAAVDPDVGPAVNGRMSRSLPRSHPICSNLYALSLVATPFGTDFLEIEPNDDTLEAPPVERHAVYRAWQFVVRFGQRPYDLLDDGAIAGTSTSINWWDTDGTPKTSTVWPEWLRYTESEVTPRPSDVLKWRKGQMVLRRQTLGKIPYTALPWVTLPNHNLKVYWYAVPYRYVKHANSYLEQWRNSVNQLEITLDGGTYAPGELLYTGYTATRYTPPFAVQVPYQPGRRAPGKLCNLVLEFIGTRGRTISDAPASRDNNTYQMAANRSFIANGMNLFLHHSDRQWYYGSSVPEALADVDNEAKQYPQFPSRPHQLLFKDPEVGELD
jgi:hypothetical protein